MKNAVKTSPSYMLRIKMLLRVLALAALPLVFAPLSLAAPSFEFDAASGGPTVSVHTVAPLAVTMR